MARSTYCRSAWQSLPLVLIGQKREIIETSTPYDLAEKDESLKDEVTETPVANASMTFEEAEEQARNEIEKYIHVMPPYEL